MNKNNLTDAADRFALDHPLELTALSTDFNGNLFRHLMADFADAHAAKMVAEREAEIAGELQDLRGREFSDCHESIKLAEYIEQLQENKTDERKVN